MAETKTHGGIIPGRQTDAAGNVPWQTRAAEPTDYEAALADALDRVLGAGHHELAAIIAGLKADGVCAPDGKAWTPDSLQAVMRRLGA